MVSANGPRIGSIIAVVARFDVISVRKLTAAMSISMSTIRETPSSKVI
jgi:DeoR/GlpR family transcriptional regulator of sugar metabolism